MNAGTMIGFIAGTAVGAAIGAGVALLYAPKAGEDLRAEIRSEADAEVQRVRDEMNARVQDLNTKLDKARNDLAAQISERLQTQPADDKEY